MTLAAGLANGGTVSIRGVSSIELDARYGSSTHKTVLNGVCDGGVSLYLHGNVLFLSPWTQPDDLTLDVVDAPGAVLHRLNGVNLYLSSNRASLNALEVRTVIDDLTIEMQVVPQAKTLVVHVSEDFKMLLTATQSGQDDGDDHVA